MAWRLGARARSLTGVRARARVACACVACGEAKRARAPACMFVNTPVRRARWWRRAHWPCDAMPYGRGYACVACVRVLAGSGSPGHDSVYVNACARTMATPLSRHGLAGLSRTGNPVLRHNSSAALAVTRGGPCNNERLEGRGNGWMVLAVALRLIVECRRELWRRRKAGRAGNSSPSGS